jgi:hypothetical protein
MTAASTARRQRRLYRSVGGAPAGTVLIDKPPLFCDLRPMTIADLLPGETWTRDMTVLEVRRCDEQGNMLPPRSLRLSLPPELRANTGGNVAEVIRQFRRIGPDIKAYFDSFALFFRRDSFPDPDPGKPMWEPRTVPG